jgi:predicted Rossmann fold nucleotide-binding protein DprA/Smf involved in DNA uptake
VPQCRSAAVPQGRSAAVPVPVPQCCGPTAQILEALDPDEAVDLDDLQASTGLDFSALTRHLTELELAGLAVRQPGGRFVRSLGKVVT